jgi:Fe-S-cluster containining protein
MNFDKILLPKGFQFDCTRCGCCCYQGKGIFLSKQEKKALGKKEHIIPNPGFEKVKSIYRWKIQTSEKGECPFLGEKNLCTVYKNRPFFCQKWPYVLNYIPDIGLFGTVVFCCGSTLDKKADDSQIKDLLKVLSKKEWYKDWLKSEKALFKSEPFRNTLRKVSFPKVADVGTGVKFWDYMASLVTTPALKKEPVRWRLWAIKEVWYLSFDFLAKTKPSHTLVEINRENSEWYLGTLQDAVKRFLPTVLSLLPKRKETMKYRPLEVNRCKSEKKQTIPNFEDKVRVHYPYEKEANALFEEYAQFYIKRQVHIPPILPLLTHLPAAANTMEQKLRNVDGYAKVFAKNNSHKSVTKDDLLRAIRLRDRD